MSQLKDPPPLPDSNTSSLQWKWVCRGLMQPSLRCYGWRLLLLQQLQQEFEIGSYCLSCSFFLSVRDGIKHTDTLSRWKWPCAQLHFTPWTQGSKCWLIFGQHSALLIGQRWFERWGGSDAVGGVARVRSLLPRLWWIGLIQQDSSYRVVQERERERESFECPQKMIPTWGGSMWVFLNLELTPVSVCMTWRFHYCLIRQCGPSCGDLCFYQAEEKETCHL